MKGVIFVVFCLLAVIYAKFNLKKEIENTNAFRGVDSEDIPEFADALKQHSAYLTSRKVYSGLNEVIDVFDCTTFGPQVPKPTSVHSLTIADIDVVMAMGDSLTAGFGALATNFLNLFNDYRAVPFSGGGAQTIVDSLTFPNFIKAYNPRIAGFSYATGNENTQQAMLNQGVTGAVTQELLPQAQRLRALLIANATYDFMNSWKVLTIFIGANNLCDLCNDYNFNSATAYIQSLEQTLDWIGSNIPRVFINVVTTVDVTELYPLSEGLCGILHGFECECGVSDNDAIRANVSATAVQYYENTLNLLSQAKYTTNDTWTAVAQPYFRNTEIPQLPNGNYDLTYFAPDCFHFSWKAHQAAAIALFNNIYQPVGSKSLSFQVGEPIDCPTSGEFLATVKNSKKA